MRSRRKVLIFDLGGVLLENTGREKLTSLLPEGTPPGDVRLRWLASPVVRRYERGHISSQDFAANLVREWGIALEPDAFLSHFAQWPKGFYPGAKELLQELRREHTVVCLSNSNEVHWARFPEIATLFEQAFSSHQIGHVKPDPEAFAFVLAAMQVHPRDAWFFDDLQPNVDAARALGINAIRVEGMGELFAALHSEALHAPEGASVTRRT